MTMLKWNSFVIVPVWLASCVVVGVRCEIGDWTSKAVTGAWPNPPGDATPRLCVFVHSRCPCTGATAETLEPIVRGLAGALTTNVYVYDPDGTVMTWVDGRWGRRFASWPRTTVVPDADLEYASRYGATASGTVYLYSADGRLLFSGGVTAGRGRPGPNPALSSLERHARGEAGPSMNWPVFGCELTTPFSRVSY